MSFFKRKPVCKRFFTYETRSLDINAISAGFSAADKAQFNFGLGDLKISPEFVRVSEMLMRKDLEQFTLCQQIANITERTERDRLFIELVQIRLEMMKIASKPQDYENSDGITGPVEQETDNPAPERKPEQIKTTVNNASQIIRLLNNPSTIAQALELADGLPFNGGDRFLFNQKRLKYQAGMNDYERIQWTGEMKDFIGRYKD